MSLFPLCVAINQDWQRTSPKNLKGKCPEFYRGVRLLSLRVSQRGVPVGA
ncbi:hypothetical protein [Roseobacter denitrificans]|nr:hypothetical protein [Roseobacter denitrificans]